MKELPNVVIVLAGCGKTRQPFGIRFEEQARGTWMADWAFAIKETSARNEGYDRSQIGGSIGLGRGYPGCPHCGAHSLFKCDCGKVVCWDAESRNVSCPWCGRSGIVGPDAIDSLSAGMDR